MRVAMSIGRRAALSIVSLICSGLSFPMASVAHDLVCPEPQKTLEPGVLKETPMQIAELGVQPPLSGPGEMLVQQGRGRLM